MIRLAGFAAFAVVWIGDRIQAGGLSVAAFGGRILGRGCHWIYWLERRRKIIPKKA